MLTNYIYILRSSLTIYMKPNYPETKAVTVNSNYFRYRVLAMSPLIAHLLLDCDRHVCHDPSPGLPSPCRLPLEESPGGRVQRTGNGWCPALPFRLGISYLVNIELQSKAGFLSSKWRHFCWTNGIKSLWTWQNHTSWFFNRLSPISMTNDENQKL